MADPAISFAVQTIGNFLIEEAKFLHGVKDKAEELHSELKRIQWFLKDADANMTEKDRIQQWILEARDIAYDAEGSLEGYAFKFETWKDGGFKNVLKRCVYILNHYYLRHKVGLEMEALLKKISKLQNSFQAYGVRAVMEKEASSSRQQLFLRRIHSFVQDDDFVGLETDVDLLVKHLVGRDHKVVSIYGMGGLGKTTLAIKAYNHPSVRRHFDRFAWISVSQQWQKKDILQRIWIKLVPEMNKNIGEEDELIKKVLMIQQTWKCLIVLDDIWTDDAWESIKYAFPTRQKSGSKILLTTRNIDVALHIGPDGFHHQPRLLNEGECWDLLKRKALRERYGGGHNMNENQYNEVEELGKKMVKCCDGLPLAVVVLGGILAAKNSLREWEAVHQNIKSYIWKGKSIGEGKGELQKILALSYHDLPFQLKHCFLYMGAFPEDADIPVQTLYQLWIAESMVLKEDRVGKESMMELAERYLEELGHRGMVQLQGSERPGMITKFSSCRLHDLMRDFCLIQAEEERFLKSITYSSEEKDVGPYDSLYGSSICKPRRLIISMDPEDVDRYAPPNKEITKYLRMFQLMVRYSYEGRMAKAIKSQLHNFHMLHSLSIEGLYPNHSSISFLTCCDVWKLPKAIGELIHLRYLSLKDSYFVVFPSSLGNLKHLLTLDLRLQAPVWRLPNILCKLKRLIFLYLPGGNNLLPCKLRLHCLSKLEVLENFGDDYCYTPDLLKLTNLRVLLVYWCKKLNNFELIAKYVQSSDMLQQVTIWNGCEPPIDDKRMEVLKQLLFGRSMYCLHVNVAMWKFPEFESNSLSSNLVELSINYCGSEEDDNICETVEKFPHLRDLRLLSLPSREMIFRAAGFVQLRRFCLLDLPNLERWVVEKGAMPNLRTLYIWRCPKLEALPAGLQFVTTLEELDINHMPSTFKERIRTPEGQEGEDFHKISHVPMVTYDFNPF
ncbi:OLC1v1019628C1 [Oldenlandia corymbosa var. corymbosa]|uniref:OLC1v1019628C1 n=1 Tax=Oldenlandia corymbosa var. corymbosa TaxID=529605 RepID=A0AAV1EEN3_OLDCO|nr:OLC1v1019628C1 [Oldenlandia corymbosa var. corymbosa]